MANHVPDDERAPEIGVAGIARVVRKPELRAGERADLAGALEALGEPLVLRRGEHLVDRPGPDQQLGLPREALPVVVGKAATAKDRDERQRRRGGGQGTRDGHGRSTFRTL